MGPTIILDKSALQTLSPSEITVLGKYYLVCHPPILISEVLADLSKQNDYDKSQTVVRNQAKKLLGSGSSVICASVGQIVASELLGNTFPMNGQVPICGGSTVTSGYGDNGILFEPTDIDAAIEHWQAGQFAVSEHRYAKEWREYTREIDLANHFGKPSSVGVNGKKPSSPEELMGIVDERLHTKNDQMSMLGMLIEASGFDPRFSKSVFSRWHVGGGSSNLGEFAPYTFQCLRVLMFFSFGLNLECDFIGTRSTNILDLEYFLYTPFCNLFVSGDKFHKRLAPALLASPRLFVERETLKTDLARLADLVKKMPREERLSNYPPELENSITTEAWKRFMKPRDTHRSNPVASMDADKKAKLTEQLRERLKYEKLDDFGASASKTEPNFILQRRKVDLNGFCECGSQLLRRDCCYSELR